MKHIYILLFLILSFKDEGVARERGESPQFEMPSLANSSPSGFQRFKDKASSGMQNIREGVKNKWHNLTRRGKEDNPCEAFKCNHSLGFNACYKNMDSNMNKVPEGCLLNAIRKGHAVVILKEEKDQFKTVTNNLSSKASQELQNCRNELQKLTSEKYKSQVPNRPLPKIPGQAPQKKPPPVPTAPKPRVLPKHSSSKTTDAYPFDKYKPGGQREQLSPEANSGLGKAYSNYMAMPTNQQQLNQGSSTPPRNMGRAPTIYGLMTGKTGKNSTDSQ